MKALFVVKSRDVGEGWQYSYALNAIEGERYLFSVVLMHSV